MPYLECRNLKRVFHHFTLDISFSMEKEIGRAHV